MTESTIACQSPAPLLLDAPAAARALSIGGRKLWELTNCRDIPSVRIGRRVLYDPEDLRAWIEQKKRRGRNA